MAFPLSIVTPEGPVFHGDVESVSATGINGSFGILANHAPMSSALEAGPVTIKEDGKDVFLAVGAGILEVSDNNVHVLADNAEKVADLEEAKAKAKELGERLKAFD